MKICINCHAGFNACDWTCPSCFHTPEILNGFYSFSPELASYNDGLEMNAHHRLTHLQTTSFWFRIRNKIIQDMIERYFSTAMNVLEIGCGSGYVLSGIREVLPNAQLVATELYANGLGYAAERISPPNEFLQLDARKLPFKDEFDLVGAFDVLEHIEEDELVVQKIKDSLKAKGGVIFTVPQHPFLWSQVDDAAHHKRRYKTKQLSSLLRDAGFEILNDTSFMFFLLPAMLFQRLITSRKKQYNPSAELSLPTFIDRIFGSILACERRLIKCGVKFPIGGSRLVVARLRN